MAGEDYERQFEIKYLCVKLFKRLISREDIYFYICPYNNRGANIHNGSRVILRWK